MKMHRCTSCQKTFKTSKEFNNHECVVALQDLPLDQLMAMYESRKSPKQ